MIGAAKTTASAGEVWAICIVAVSCLAFWLSMVAWADRHPIWRGRQVPEMQGPVLGGMHVGGGGRSVAPSRAAPAVLTSEDETEYEQSGHEMATSSQRAQAGAAPAADRPVVPGQRGAQSRPAGERATDSGVGVPRGLLRGGEVDEGG